MHRLLAHATRTTILVTLAACGAPEADSGDATSEAEPAADPVMTTPGIQATNAFYYYEDVDAAHAFYTDILDFETVVDYGFAKILRVAPTSYITLVDEAEGMHSSEEPKSVTLAVVTEEVEEWYDYLVARDVAMRGPYQFTEGRPHDGFVAIDPEGYYLEFERFNPHDENTELLPRLGAVEPLGPATGSRPGELTVQATVLWLYYRDIPAMQGFWEQTLGVDLMVDQGWAKVYPASSTGYIGLVDGERGLHQATEDKAVTVSFITDDVAAWLDRVKGFGMELRTPELASEGDRVQVFVGYDPEGYFLEWDTFVDLPENARLLELLAQP